MTEPYRRVHQPELAYRSDRTAQIGMLGNSGNSVAKTNVKRIAANVIDHVMKNDFFSKHFGSFAR